MNKILSIENLRISFQTYAGKVEAVRGVNLSVKQGETLAIVGESGSGKSVTVKAIMRLLPKKNVRIESGHIIFENKDLLTLDTHDMNQVRGSDIAMIFQDPMTSLNPTMKVGKQVVESARKHRKLSKKEALNVAVDLFELVRIPNAKQRIHQYPHEFSGGMRQRVVIAMALACNPKLLIADEPTTALDVTIQAQILELLKQIQKEMNTSIIFITHDLGVVANMADSVAVMYAGRIVEIGKVDEIFYQPNHPYTAGLLKSMPDMTTTGELYSIPGSPPDMIHPPKGDAFASRNEYALAIDYEKQPPMFPITNTHFAATWLLHPQAPKIDVTDHLFKRKNQKVNHSPRSKRLVHQSTILSVNHLKKHFTLATKQTLKAVNGVSLRIRKGETLGLVGESGCGKSTVARTILGLYEPTEGEIYFKNKKVNQRNSKEFCRKVQMIFQDPYASLNPRKKVEDIIAEGIDIHNLASNPQERTKRIEKLLKVVGLQKEHADRYPHEFSGGQRQRIGIARALAVEPEVIIADEPISALDVSIQAQIVNLLMELQQKRELTYLFIAHDLSMVKYISDRIGVMYLGSLVELADSDRLTDRPLHPYTKALLSAVPKPDPDYEKQRERIILEGPMPSPVKPPKGCPFQTRCPIATDKCMTMPEWREVENNHWVACHYA